jgi:hypothetical protein
MGDRESAAALDGHRRRAKPVGIDDQHGADGGRVRVKHETAARAWVHDGVEAVHRPV